jgi:general stress protein YciG
MTDKPKSKRGFASFSPEKLAAAAAKGGASVPPEKRSFAVNRGLAASAGKKGGEAHRPTAGKPR